MKKTKLKYLTLFLASLLSLEAFDLKGEAFLKTQGGSIMTCAGEKVYINKKYKLEKQGNETQINPNDFVTNYDYLLVLHKTALIEAQLGYKESVSRVLEKSSKVVDVIKNIPKSKYTVTHCDRNGNFEFTNLEKGSYVVGTTVEWVVAGEKQGGFLKKEITINKDSKVILTE
ncbi:hypothetical protein AAX26_00901 [Aliarcobacter thereius]|uniref:hypothetical protein n=1 Tax=Aliarcobacter thereius TaxID=544718 RepID=UPI000828F139|nr:hypothetical protein [Aliarcobacter thereius]OCL87808.1 hypothetical protein AAX26_00901 [Aliarcobacter thereius]